MQITMRFLSDTENVLVHEEITVDGELNAANVAAALTSKLSSLDDMPSLLNLYFNYVTDLNLILYTYEMLADGEFRKGIIHGVGHIHE